MTLDPAFPISSNKRIKKEIHIKYTNAIGELKILLENTYKSTSLTTDLQTSKSKHGYINITLYWISENFKIYNCLLYIERMLYPHIRTNIVSFLKKKVVEFGLKGKITCVVTDNRSNMINAINQQDDVNYLPYAAYTLQLSINCAFQKTNIYIKRIKCLIHFFTSSPKQSEHPDDTQKECQWYNNTTSQNISDSFTDDDTDNNDNSTNELSMLDLANSKELIL